LGTPHFRISSSLRATLFGRLKRVISGTCDGNVDWRVERGSRKNTNELEEDRWLAKIKRENRECRYLQRENRE
jgi:hypothetical protein